MGQDNPHTLAAPVALLATYTGLSVYAGVEACPPHVNESNHLASTAAHW